jgi:hypothetical protein
MVPTTNEERTKMKYEDAQQKAANEAKDLGVPMAVVAVQGKDVDNYETMALSTAVAQQTYVWCRYYPPQGIHAHGNFWMGMISERDDLDHVIVKGTHYTIGPEDPNIRRQWRGFHGDRYVIKFRDGRTVTSTNLWCQGTIPLQYRDELPDNAEFMREHS